MYTTGRYYLRPVTGQRWFGIGQPDPESGAERREREEAERELYAEQDAVEANDVLEHVENGDE